MLFLHSTSSCLQSSSPGNARSYSTRIRPSHPFDLSGNIFYKVFFSEFFLLSYRPSLSWACVLGLRAPRGSCSLPFPLRCSPSGELSAYITESPTKLQVQGRSVSFPSSSSRASSARAPLCFPRPQIIPSRLFIPLRGNRNPKTTKPSTSSSQPAPTYPCPFRL